MFIYLLSYYQKRAEKRAKAKADFEWGVRMWELKQANNARREEHMKKLDKISHSYRAMQKEIAQLNKEALKEEKEWDKMIEEQAEMDRELTQVETSSVFLWATLAADEVHQQTASSRTSILSSSNNNRPATTLRSRRSTNHGRSRNSRGYDLQ